MRSWLFLSQYHWTALLILLALSATVVAWLSFGLINVAMANYGFLTQHGLIALREGGFLQLLEVVSKAGLALAAYLIFKATETELIYRWRNAGPKRSTSELGDD